jgi:7-cyano-7-deazaguanine synthase
MNKYAVLSLSGGMDSSTLLLHLLSEGYQVTALSFDYGQKHKIELERATQLVEYLNLNKSRTLVHEGAIDEYYHKIKHQIIELKGLSSLLNSTLVEGGKDIPEGHYEASNMSQTVVPNRNKIFSSIIQAVALSIAEKNNCECQIALGIHSGDHRIYFDCRAEFRDADYEAFLQGNENGKLVTPYTPYLHTDKFGILADGAKCCIQLGLDFNEVYKRTNTSYKPIYIEAKKDIDRMIIPGTRHIPPSGKWYSDYKSASSVERIEAFIKLGIPDPCEYADETGPVTWEVAKSHVEKILQSSL